MLKILFVWPNKDAMGFKPIGLSLLISLCREQGYNVDLFETTYLDLGYTTTLSMMEDIAVFKPVDLTPYYIEKKKVPLETLFQEKLKTFDPDVVAISALSDEIQVGIECARIAKNHNKNIINILGGKYATTSPEKALEQEPLDYVCIGEGLEVFIEFLDALEVQKDPSAIDSIWGKKNDIIFRNKIRPLKKNLDDLPYVDWTLFDKRNIYKPYDGEIVRGGDWMLNFGCVNECTYCINKFLYDTYGKKGFLRRYTPERAIKELQFLKENYALNFLKFHDEDFLLRPIEHIESFASLYKSKVNLPFVIETNPKSINEEKASILKEMNCVSASIGVESGNEHLRKNVLNRTESLDDIKNACAILNNNGIRSSCFLMLNIPFDNREAIFDSIQLVRDARFRVPNVGVFFPFEKTRARDIAIENNFYDPEEVPTYRQDLPALNQPSISRDEINRLRKVFILYAKLPKSYWPLIERAELFDDTGKEIYSILKDIYIQHVREQGDFFEEISS